MEFIADTPVTIKCCRQMKRCLPLTCSLFPAEMQHCLVSAGDVGCGVFECFENNSCEIRGLQEICMTFLHNAGKFDSQVLNWSVCVFCKNGLTIGHILSI